MSHQRNRSIQDAMLDAISEDRLSIFTEILCKHPSLINASLAHHLLQYGKYSFFFALLKICHKIAPDKIGAILLEHKPWKHNSLIRAVFEQCQGNTYSAYTGGNNSQCRRTILEYLESVHDSIDATMFRQFQLEIQSVDIKGQTLLHYYAGDELKQLIQTIVKWSGADALCRMLKTVDANGQNPLYSYVQRIQTEDVEFLIWLGCDLVVARNKSLIDTARWWGKPHWSRCEGVYFMRHLGCTVTYTKHLHEGMDGQDWDHDSNFWTAYQTTLLEDEVLDTRHRVYFRRSLVARLLWFI